MKMYDIIIKKRDNAELSKEETDFFISGYTDGSIPHEQASAMLMAMFIRGLNQREIFMLTDAMMRSGDTVDLSGIDGIKVDKHSTGGVGDKTTFIVAPLAAACGVPVAKMSGRGLGFTGGTVDKMESIPGMKTALDREDFISLVNRNKISLIGQTGHIAPADKKIYALRDVTGTVENLGLIASSIMSKKLASGSDAFVLDVKCGNGAFMETREDARALAEMMVSIGESAGKKTIALVTNMDEPLGRGVGNSIEVIEAIETLKGRGEKDITELSLCLASYMLLAGGVAKTAQEGYERVTDALNSGAGLSKLREVIAGQGGDPGVIDDYGIFPQAKHSSAVTAAESGFISRIEARVIGMASRRAGAGRETLAEAIDMSAGIIFEKKVGDEVLAGELVATVYGDDAAKIEEAAKLVRSAFTIGREKPKALPLIIDIIGI